MTTLIRILGCADVVRRLTDDQVRQAIRGLLEGLLAWSRRLRHP